MTHAHATVDVPPAKRKALDISAAVIAMALVTAMFVLWPSTSSEGGLAEHGTSSEFHGAHVESIEEGPRAGTGSVAAGCGGES